MTGRSTPLSDSASLSITEIHDLCSASAESPDVARKLAALQTLAGTRPHDLVPHIEAIASLLDSASGVVREGSLDTLTLLSRVAPGAVAFLLPRLHDLLANDPQNIVANRAIEILTNYARTGTRAAQRVLPIFASTIDRLGVRNAAKVLTALRQLVREVPGLGKSALRIGQQFEQSIAVSLRGAAQKLRAAIAD